MAKDSGDRLAYVALAVSDVGRVRDVFESGLGLAPCEVRIGRDTTAPAYPVGETALLPLEAGDPFLDAPDRAGVDHIAVACADPEARARGLGLTIAAVGTGLHGNRQVRLSPYESFGVCTRLVEPVSFADSVPGVPGVVDRVDHIGVASHDNATASGFFRDVFGWPVESTQTDMEVRIAVESFTSDKYGVVYHTRAPEPIGGLRVTFINIGDCALELLQPLVPEGRANDESAPLGDTPGSTRDDKGAIGRYLERRGPGLHHVALKVADIDAVLGRLADLGCRLIDRAGRPGSRRARIGFIHPSALGRALVHLVQRDES